MLKAFENVKAGDDLGLTKPKSAFWSICTFQVAIKAKNQSRQVNGMETVPPPLRSGAVPAKVRYTSHWHLHTWWAPGGGGGGPP